MKVYANENLEEMSFISINFSTLFYKRNRKVSEKGEISLIVVAAPKVRQKEDDTDFYQKYENSAIISESSVY